MVLALLACGLVEVLIQHRPSDVRSFGLLIPASVSTVGVGALAWMAFEVGALSFGGGFVIIPLMQGDAVHTYHWMTNAQFLNAMRSGRSPRDRSWRPSPASVMQPTVSPAVFSPRS